MFGKLPQVIGVYADPNYRNTEYFEELFNRVPPGSIVTFPLLNKFDVKMRNTALMRLSTDRVKVWDVEFENDYVLRRGEQDRMADHMFLSYLKYFGSRRSHLFIFPYPYDKLDATSYSDRIQSMIIKAHLLGVKYTVIREGTLDDLLESIPEDAVLVEESSIA